MTVKTDVYHIIKSLQDKGVIKLAEQDINRMQGTTDGLIYTLSENNTPKYVLKLDHPQKIAFVEHFFRAYRHVSLLPKMIYTDPEKEFIVYSYIAGTTHYNRGTKLDWMTLLVKELFNQYEKCDQNSEWGRLGIPRKSWREFNMLSVESAFENVAGILPVDDYYNVKSAVERIAEYERQEEKYILHGDTGIHNFVFNNKTLTGIIDPSPMIGPVVYDFTYAFCSSPEDMDLETLFTAFSFLKPMSMKKSRLVEEVIIQLYTRIGICVKVHPHDLKGYLKAWKYWSNLIS